MKNINLTIQIISYKETPEGEYKKGIMIGYQYEFKRTQEYWSSENRHYDKYFFLGDNQNSLKQVNVDYYSVLFGNSIDFEL